MGMYLSTGIIVKITSKLPLKEAIEKKVWGENSKNLSENLFEEIYSPKSSKYEYYPKCFNLEELKNTKIKFWEDYNIKDKNKLEEERSNIEKFFQITKANSSKELFDELENYNIRGMEIDEETLYIGFTIYKLRLSLEGKMFLEGYGKLVAFMEKIIKERYNNDYSKYIKIDLS